MIKISNKIIEIIKKIASRSVVGIIEEGDKEGWHYRKYSNGYAECWCYKNVTIAKTGSQWIFGNNGPGGNITLPSDVFLNNQTQSEFNVSYMCTNYLCESHYGYVSTSNPSSQVYIGCYNAHTTGATSYYIHVIGKWAPSTPVEVSSITTTPPMVDYIVEQGVSGIWTYRKWNSGIAECWGTVAKGGHTNTGTWGSIYTSGPSNTISANYPTGLFIDVPNCIATPAGGTGSFWTLASSGLNGTKDSTPKFETARGGTASNFSVYVAFHAIGRWK